MRQSHLLGLLPWLAAASPIAEQHDRTQIDSISNANHIFNSIHDSMRQFGSSLNHNGMGIFIATVPEGTEFYHGTSSQYRINGTEWLAFEPEHAMIFARSRGPGGPGGPGRRPGGGPPGERPHEEYEDEEEDDNLRGLPHHQPNGHGNKETHPEQNYGYLHTYRTKHPLRLIYVDGQSAAKSNKGTLDVQDLILRNHTSPDGDQGRGMMGEKERADDLCQLIHTEYADHLDGILRMEGGFEIILCDFAKDLDVVRILPAKASSMGPGGDGLDHFNYWQAISARYFDIGANRVRLDYESFITLFAYPTAIHFDDTNRPRVKNNTAELEVVRQDIKKMVLGPDSTADATNWQAITDLIVTRYADRIAYMASGDLTTLPALTSEIDRALRPFIDYGSRNSTLEAARCATQFWPSPAAIEPSVAARAIKQTYQTVCTALASASHLDSHAAALETVRQLKKHLAWTTWKICKDCARNEICMVPVWPMGSAEDFVQPPCVSSDTIGERRGDYWGGFGGRRRRRRKEKHHKKVKKQDKKGRRYA
ncbi:hypothetical protein BDV97DRAFT_380193 [Delphinella strobiligena]|nr:hypothetical protein BDV97DRAFT_380193 [Delphinella strobiligena]